MRVTWISGTRWLMSSAILIAFAGVKTALAQYVVVPDKFHIFFK